MKHSLRFLMVGLVVPAVMLAGVVAGPVMAQDKAKGSMAAPAKAKKGEVELKVYLDNDQVRVFQATFKPGDVGGNVVRPLRVIHPLKGGTITLIYPDGKKEKLVLKTGETLVRQPTPQYMPKNEGKSDIVLFVVYVKEPKK